MKTKFRPYTGWGVAHPIQVSLLFHCSGVLRKRTDSVLIDFERKEMFNYRRLASLVDVSPS